MASIFEKPSFCLITGASRGLGREIALQFSQKLASSGAGKSYIVLLARSKDGLEETKSMIAAATPEVTVHTFSIDLGDLDKLQTLCPELMKLGDSSCHQQFILVHNAGTIDTFQYTLAQHTDGHVTQKYFDINYTSMTVLSAYFLSTFPKESSVIVHISSLLATVHVGGLPLYCPSRAARHAFMGVLVAENPEVRVLNYCPGPCDTDMHKQVPESMKKGMDAVLQPEESIRRLVKILRENEFKNGCSIDYYDK